MVKYVVKYRDDDECIGSVYLRYAGDMTCSVNRNKAFEFESLVEAAGEIERLNRENDMPACGGHYYAVPVLPKRGER